MFLAAIDDALIIVLSKKELCRPRSRAHTLLLLLTHSLRCGLEEYRQLRWLTYTFVHSSSLKVLFYAANNKGLPRCRSGMLKAYFFLDSCSFLDFSSTPLASFSLCCLSFAATAASLSPMICAARMPALVAPALPIATAATGMPAGIWTMESSESS